MIHLVYVSSATRHMSDTELENLLKECKENNKNRQVTGMLLYSDGNFIQALEGEKNTVENIYSSILNDERNKDNIIIEKDSILQRNFPNWSMGFQYLNNEHATIIDGYSDFLKKDIPPEEVSNKQNSILNLLYSFKHNLHA